MAYREKAIKKRESRIKQRSREKEELFVADYIKQKYPDIHDEALQVYRLLVKKHPDKPDIRKTAEHKTWKIMNATTIHPAFNILESASIPALAQMRICFSQQSTETLTTLENPSTIESTTTPEPSTTEPSITSESSTTEPTITSESSTIEPTITPEPPNPKTSPEPPNPPNPKGKAMYSDNLQLIIPLLEPPSKHPGLITETLQIVTEEILQEEEEEQQQQQHLNIDQIDPQTMEQIIGELRADPNLKDLFADIEHQFEQGNMDIDIDIGMDTRLEDELNWEFW